MTNNLLMQIQSIAECSVEHYTILLTCIKLSNGFTTFVLSIFEWPHKTSFTVYPNLYDNKVRYKGLYVAGLAIYTFQRANNRGPDQPVTICRLVCAIVVCMQFKFFTL